DSNGRFHTDWLNMIYPRLRLAKDLLKDDGVIFISIDDNEVENLKKVCNEVFGESNFVDYFLWTKTSTPPSLSHKSRKVVEFVLCYEKNKNNYRYFGSLLDNCDAPLLN
ncbi:MAG: site-specific DNA-methyltransferase, partial [Eubacterium sp.]